MLVYPGNWVVHSRAYLFVLYLRYFKQTKFASFQRQLNLYGFLRIHQGDDKGSYYNLCFVRGHRSLIRQMVRRKIKGYREQRPSPLDEPNFYLPQWKNHFEASIPPSLRRQSLVSSNGPAVVFVPVPAKDMMSASQGMMSYGCQPLAFSQPHMTQSLMNQSWFSFNGGNNMNEMQAGQVNPFVAEESRSCKDLLSMALDLDTSSSSQQQISPTFLTTASRQVSDDEFEPIPLREDCGFDESTSSNWTSFFTLVDPDKNIYQL
mmetsp:Transcript_25600/g.58769  ORF Transcript_25600/g.58769 Transcript_25600/m.58769 type:complete len:262 (+) Transcript_25600:339-1124(+)